MLRVMLIVGTRPDAIKVAPVVLALQQAANEFTPILCSTGQHRQMLDQSLAAFGLMPAIDLDLMQPNQTLASLTARAVTGLDAVLAEHQPDLVLVHGDTATALAGSLAAYYRQIPVGHIEAGLRTNDRYQPFPEEGNRRLIDVLTTLYFPPTPAAASNLLREGYNADEIFVTGNTVIDALLYVQQRLQQEPLPAERQILLTMHRRESYGAPFEAICQAIVTLLERNPTVRVLFPVHAAPAVHEPVDRLLRGHPQITLTEPLAYEAFVRALDRSTLVLTDSGGIQEEAPALGKPVLVLRDKTERLEAIEAGTACLVGSDAVTIIETAERLLQNEHAYAAMAHAVNPYGDGHASGRIVAALRYHFGLTADRPAPFQ